MSPAQERLLLAVLTDVGQIRGAVGIAEAAGLDAVVWRPED